MGFIKILVLRESQYHKPKMLTPDAFGKSKINQKNGKFIIVHQFVTANQMIFIKLSDTLVLEGLSNDVLI